MQKETKLYTKEEVHNEMIELVAPMENKACYFNGVLAVLHKVSTELTNTDIEKTNSLYLYQYIRTLVDMTDLAIDELEQIQNTVERVINKAYKGA